MKASNNELYEWLNSEEKVRYLLHGKAIFRLIRKLAHPKKPIGDDSMNVTERMDGATKVTTVVNKRVR